MLSLSGEPMLRSFTELFISPAESATWEKFVAKDLPVEQSARIREFLRALLEYPARYDRLASFRAPVLLVVGADTHPDVGRRAEGLGALFPRARVVRFPGCQRFRPAHSQPEFRAMIRELWKDSDTDPSEPPAPSSPESSPAPA